MKGQLENDTVYSASSCVDSIVRMANFGMMYCTVCEYEGCVNMRDSCEKGFTAILAINFPFMVDQRNMVRYNTISILHSFHLVLNDW